MLLFFNVYVLSVLVGLFWFLALSKIKRKISTERANCLDNKTWRLATRKQVKQKDHTWVLALQENLGSSHNIEDWRKHVRWILNEKVSNEIGKKVHWLSLWLLCKKPKRVCFTIYYSPIFQQSIFKSGKKIPSVNIDWSLLISRWKWKPKMWKQNI